MTLALPVMAAPKVQLFHRPGCMCCEQYADYLVAQGFAVQVSDNTHVAAVNAQHNVPRRLASCHTTLIGDYVVVGHVPVKAIHKLLSQQPHIRGIALPGMRMGSPGMGGEQRRPFVIRTLDGGVYMIINS